MFSAFRTVNSYPKVNDENFMAFIVAALCNLKFHLEVLLCSVKMYGPAKLRCKKAMVENNQLAAAVSSVSAVFCTPAWLPSH